MKRLIAFLSVITIVALGACAQAQDSFYGTWINTSSGSLNGEVKMEYTITAKTFISIYTPELVSLLTPVEKNTFEIFSWEKITNDNSLSKDDYPNGYLVGLRSGLGTTTIKLFMCKDKVSLIAPYYHNGAYRQDIYRKQKSTTKL